MPATAKKNSAAHLTNSLITNLSKILGQVSIPNGEPIVVESQIAQTKSIHVVVIWDAWKGMPSAERSKIIIDAYAKAKRARGSTITVAMGLSNAEALNMGFLPFSIVTTRRQTDGVAADKLAKAMNEAGGVAIKVGSSMQLRFATLEQAEDAYRILSQKIPGPYWAIVQELPAAE